MQMETAFAVPFQKRDDETFYNYCLSFSPAAPFFGVPWRFAPKVKVTADAPEAEVKDVAPAIETLEAAVEVMAAGIAATAKLVAAPADDAPVDVPPVDVPAEAPVEAAVEVEAVVETVAEDVAEDTQTDLLGAASAAPSGLFAEAPAVIDDLKLIKGVGPKLEAELNGIGIYTFAQIAAMTEPQLIWLDEQISSVRGRPMRDDWAGQSKALAG